ncbi:MAG TPA: hypothetical protein VFO89_09285 [Thermoanaerobaculia bacterium]|nr:hypothetical protein [Thermoanaerobaculia bacterium]
MKHASEHLLSVYALDPALVPRRAAVEAHLGDCTACRARLEEIRAFDASLREPEAWSAAAPEAGARGEELRAFVLRAEEEDAAAVALLKRFEHPDAAANFVWENVPRRAEYQTGGVARRLCRMANGMCERRPLYALSLAEAATRIAALLPDATYPRHTVHELRGEAWKEQANAFRYLGRFPEALNALDRAEEEYRKLPLEGVGIVAVQYVRAYVLFEQDQFDVAEKLAGESAVGALHLGDSERFMRARHLQGEILYEQRQFAEAAEIFAIIMAYGENHSNALWIARESLTLGQCQIELRSLVEASKLLHRALRLFTDLKFPSEVTRSNWGIARLNFLEGRTTEATHRLRTAIQELTRLGMLTDAALAAVDLSEMLHSLGRTREVPMLLTGVVRTFTAAGKLTGALTALAYLKKAATAREIASTAFPCVRRFIVRTERQQDLIFTPPPAP